MNPNTNQDLIQLTREHGVARAILDFITEHVKGYDAVVCSYAVIQEALNISQATVARNIKILKNKGYITIFKSGSSNIYAVNNEHALKAWNQNQGFTKLSVNVIVSATEQDNSN